jgi:signal transduction histidine kinase/integral membrane sensor domain MASE1/ActR/RegA family two-component response regulator
MLDLLAPNKSLWWKSGLTLLLYLAAAALSLSWPSSVGGVSHLYLASGFALACVISWGWWMALPVGIGSALVVLCLSDWGIPTSLAWTQTLVLSLTSGVGAATQAWVGARLTQGRHQGAPMPLDSMRAIAKFFLLAGPVACLINATISSSALFYLGQAPSTSWPIVISTWWVGDTVGVLLGAPILLTLMGQPHELWQQRRKAVGIPLVIAAILMGWSVGLLQKWEQEKALAEFRRQADATASGLRTQLHDHLNALEALRGLFESSEQVTRREFQHASQYWLNQQTGIQALGWSEQVSGDQLTMFEQTQRSEGLRQFEVFDLPGKLRSRNQALVVKFVEPMSLNHKALGYNMLSSTVTREAFELAVASDTPVSTPPSIAWQASTTSIPQGIVIYRTINNRAAMSDLAPPNSIHEKNGAQGAIFAVIRLDETLQSVLRGAPPFMLACLKDVTDGHPKILAGGAGCKARQHLFSHDITLSSFAQRQWVLSLSSDSSSALGNWTLMSALFGLVGVTLAAAMGSLLLLVTGNAAKMAAAMSEALEQRQAAEAASHAKSEFLSRMSHELRTPLNAMLGFAQVMELDPSDPLHATQQSRLGQIQQAGWHLLDLIDDVLDIANIDSDAMPMKPEPVSVDAALSVCLNTVEAMRQKQQVQITVRNLIKGQWGAMADPTRLQQVLSNLLSNAVKFNKAGGHVQVLVSVVQHITSSSADQRAQPMVVLTVTDTGKGMASEQLAQLFQPFSRLGRATGEAAGMGIGLAISRHLTQLMGGTLDATSKPGDGTVLTLTLPAARMPVANDAQADSPTNNARAIEKLPGQKHVLYVEDNEVNSEVMQAIMRERPHIHLQIEGTIEAGLAALHDRTRNPLPDLILLDVHLPDASGAELLSLLKANPDTRDIPVVMISADAMPEQIDACLSAGAACYLTKPIQIRVLLKQIDDLL